MSEISIIALMDDLKKLYLDWSGMAALYSMNPEKYEDRRMDLHSEIYKKERKLLAALLVNHLELDEAQSGPLADLGGLLQAVSLELRVR